MQIKDRNYARVTHPTNVAQHENAIYDIISLQYRVLTLKKWFKDLDMYCYYSYNTSHKCVQRYN